MIDNLDKEGNFKVSVTDKSGKLIHREIKNNDVYAILRQQINDAIIDQGYDWDGTTPANIIAGGSYVSANYGIGANVPSSSGASISTANGQKKTAIEISQTYTIAQGNGIPGGYRCVLKGSSAATASSGVISFSSSITGIGGSFTFGKWGVLDSFSSSGDGEATWLRFWAHAGYSSITLTSDDTLTIDWTMTLAGS